MVKNNYEAYLVQILALIEKYEFLTIEEMYIALKMSDIRLRGFLKKYVDQGLIKYKKLRLKEGRPPISVYFVCDYSQELKEKVLMKYNPVHLARIKKC